jgi:flagellar motor protein MotB
MKTSYNMVFNRSLSLTILTLILIAGPLSGCSTVKKGWTSTKDAVSSLFGDDEEAASAAPEEKPAETAPAPMTGGGGLFGTSSGAFRSSSEAAPSLSSVPTQAPTPPSSEPERKKTVEGLIADRAKAEYTEQGGRQEPVTVRPLNENPSAPEIAGGGPPRPQAAPTESVTRLAEAPPSPSTSTLAERLSAPPPSAPVVVTPAPVTPTSGLMPTPVAPVPSSIQPLIPAARSIADYDDETIVVDGSGVRGGRGILAPLQTASARASFDPGNASVSSDVGTVSFASGSAALSSTAKAMLADVARLRAQTDGALRIVGRGDQASARAAAVSRELRRLGVPAARLYDGGADSTMLGDAADIYLDY